MGGRFEGGLVGVKDPDWAVSMWPGRYWWGQLLALRIHWLCLLVTSAYCPLNVVPPPELRRTFTSEPRD